MIAWLIGPTVAALAGAFVVIRIFEALFQSAPEAVRGIVFTGAWAAITTKLGMNRVDKTTRGLRLKTNSAKKSKLNKFIDALTKGE